MILRPVAPPVEYGITKRLARAGNAAIAFLRSLGTSAHVWLPGANGVSVASLPSNNYLLSDGSTGYSTVDGVDGLDLDGMGGLGAELSPDPSFDIPGSWAAGAGISVSGGNATYASPAHGANLDLASHSFVAGKTYVVTITVPAYTSGRVTVYINKTTGTTTGGTKLATGVGSFQTIIAATTNGTGLGLQADAVTAGACIMTLSVCSVKEYTGTHLTQATTANKPLVRRGAYNLLTYSHTLTNTAWAVSTATRNSANVATASGADQFVFQGGAAASAAANPYTAAFVVSRLIGSGTIFISSDSGFTYTAISVTSTPTLFIAAASAGTVLRGAALKFATSGDSVQIDGVGLFQGTWTAAQILAEGGIPTTTATAASNPSAGKYWWSFDGSNDSLLSGNLGITNACTIVIAGRVDSLGASRMLVNEDTNGVQFVANTDGSVVFGKANIVNFVTSSAGTLVAGVPFVLTIRLSGSVADIRKNGVQVASAATGGVTFSATTGMRVGAQFPGGLFFYNGALGWVVPIAAALSDADCLTVERLVSSQFPNGPVF